MIDEMIALDANHTWELVPPSSEIFVVGYRCLLNVKAGLDGQDD